MIELNCTLTTSVWVFYTLYQRLLCSHICCPLRQYLFNLDYIKQNSNDAHIKKHFPPNIWPFHIRVSSIDRSENKILFVLEKYDVFENFTVLVLRICCVRHWPAAQFILRRVQAEQQLKCYLLGSVPYQEQRNRPDPEFATNNSSLDEFRERYFSGTKNHINDGIISS